ncbi:MAG TPA: hypothetical protein VL742_01450 [Casimicrobiaceae bacterium]|nr:hypothetical protein [Casimicrobiaceae bacterium]
MARCKRFWQIAPFSLCAVVSCASAQIAPPVLEVDFTTGTAAPSVPLSPALCVAIAVAIAAAALFMLRRTRGGAQLVLALSAASLAYALMHTPIVSHARAAPPPIPLSLMSSPTIVTGPSYFDYIQATNETGSRIKILAVKYDPGGYDYYLDTATTTCIHGLVLGPGASCLIRILSLG